MYIFKWEDDEEECSYFLLKDQDHILTRSTSACGYFYEIIAKTQERSSLSSFELYL